MFLNTSLGINEEDVFDIPEYCDQPMEQFNLENECSPEQYQTTMLSEFFRLYWIVVNASH